MENSANLDLPYIMPSQAQKHVTHNEALSILDALVQLSVVSATVTAPPGSPAEGQRWIVPAAATGAWAGQVGKIAAWYDGAWLFLSPRQGWTAYSTSATRLLAFNGSVWVDAINIGIADITTLGVNATADASNRLSVKSNGVLLSHDDVTPGTGDMRMTMNKSAAAKDAGIIFQDGFSARALLGLLASDDFVAKVTPDASSYFASMRAHRLLHGRISLKPSRREHPVTWLPQAGAVGYNAIGLAVSTTGTVATVAPTSTNLFTQSPRDKITSAASAGAVATLRGGQLLLWRGNSAGLGGFYMCMRGGIETFQSTCRMFIGLHCAAADIGNVNPSTLLNMVGTGFDSGQTTLRLFTNDGSGAAAAIDLGAGFPTTGGQDLYELILSAEPNGSEIRYRVERLNGGNVAEGALTSDLPAATQFLTPHFWLNTGTATGAVELAPVSMFAEPGSLHGSRGSIG